MGAGDKGRRLNCSGERREGGFCGEEEGRVDNKKGRSEGGPDEQRGQKWDGARIARKKADGFACSDSRRRGRWNNLTPGRSADGELGGMRGGSAARD